MQLGEDGQLPELSLDEELTGGKSELKTRRSNSLLLSLLLAASVAASVLLLVIEGPVGGSGDRERGAARTTLKNILQQTQPRKADQPEADWRLLVHDALSAAARSDRTNEQRAYDRLLNLLNAEDRRKSSLTGDEARDEDLEKAIAILKDP